MLYTLFFGVTLEEIRDANQVYTAKELANQLIQEQPQERTAVVDIMIQRFRQTDGFDTIYYMDWIVDNAPEKVLELLPSALQHWIRNADGHENPEQSIMWRGWANQKPKHGRNRLLPIWLNTFIKLHHMQ